MTEEEVKHVADRTTAHVLSVIEEQLREFAAIISPAVPASVALLALADDIRDNIQSITGPRIRCVVSNPSPRKTLQ